MAFRNIQAGMATYRGHGGDRGDAYSAHPTNPGPHPGVVIIHHMPGWDEWTCEVARKFAHHGYAAIAPSLYFRISASATAPTRRWWRRSATAAASPTIRCSAMSRGR